MAQSLHFNPRLSRRQCLQALSVAPLLTPAGLLAQSENRMRGAFMILITGADSQCVRCHPGPGLAL